MTHRLSQLELWWGQLVWILGTEKQMCMTRKYHNHTLQTKPRHRDDQSQDIRKTIKAKQPPLSLPRQDDCKTIKGILHNKTRNKQRTATKYRRYKNQRINNTHICMYYARCINGIGSFISILGNRCVLNASHSHQLFYRINLTTKCQTIQRKMSQFIQNYRCTQQRTEIGMYVPKD